MNLNCLSYMSSRTQFQQVAQYFARIGHNIPPILAKSQMYV